MQINLCKEKKNSKILQKWCHVFISTYTGTINQFFEENVILNIVLLVCHVMFFPEIKALKIFHVHKQVWQLYAFSQKIVFKLNYFLYIILVFIYKIFRKYQCHRLFIDINLIVHKWNKSFLISVFKNASRWVNMCSYDKIPLQYFYKLFIKCIRLCYDKHILQCDMTQSCKSIRILVVWFTF